MHTRELLISNILEFIVNNASLGVITYRQTRMYIKNAVEHSLSLPPVKEFLLGLTRSEKL